MIPAVQLRNQTRNISTILQEQLKNAANEGHFEHVTHLNIDSVRQDLEKAGYKVDSLPGTTFTRIAWDNPVQDKTRWALDLYHLFGTVAYMTAELKDRYWRKAEEMAEKYHTTHTPEELFATTYWRDDV